MQKSKTKLFLVALLLLSLMVQMTPPAVFAVDIKGDQSSIMKIITPEAPTHTYNFKVDGQLVQTQIVKNNEFLLQPEAPEKADHKFIGWYVGDNPIDFSQAVTVTLTEEFDAVAKFEKVYYVFFMDCVGDDARVFKTKEGTSGTQVFTTDVILPLGSTQAVTGWYKDQVLTDGPVGDYYTIEEANQNLWPKIENGNYLYFVSGENGTYIEPQFVPPGKNTVEPTAPTRPGYTFSHWSETEGGAVYTFGQPLAANLTLYAVWTPKSNTSYTVVFWKQSVNDNKNATNDEKTYDFAESEVRTAASGATVSPTTADGNKSYPNFHYNASKSESVTVKGDGTTILNIYYDRNLLTIDFYRYQSSGWSGSWVIDQTMTGLYGQTLAQNGYTWPSSSRWSRWNASGSTLTFLDSFIFDPIQDYLDPNKTDTIRLQQRSLDTDATITHYKENLDGTWSKANEIKSGGGTFYLGDKYTGFTVAYYSTNGTTWHSGTSGQGVSYSTKLYIRHTRNSYILTFYNYNAVAKTEELKFEAPLSGQSGYVPPKPAGLPDEYVFKGWYKDSACSEPFNFATETMPSNNLMIYAKWAPPVVAGTIYLNTEGTGIPVEKTLTYGQKIGPDDMPTVKDHQGNVLSQGDGINFVTVPANHEWIGWSTKDGDDYITFNFDTLILSDIVLYPYYVDNSKLTVTYNTVEGDGSSGNPPTDGNKYAKGSYAEIKSPTGLTPPTDKVFLGWKITKVNGTPVVNGTIYQPVSKILITGHMTLTAQWGDINTGTFITYDANGGTGGPTTINLANNETHTIIENTFTLVGYVFAGWNSKADGSGTTFNAGTKVTVDRINQETENILYAQWTRSVKDVVVTKNWVGGHAVNHTRVVIDLYRTPEGGTEEKVTQEPVVTPSSGTHDTFTHTWENLPTHTEQGDLYTYRVAEPTVHSSYTAVVSGEGYVFTVTNTYHNSKEVEAKKYWRGVVDTSDKVAVWFTLYRTTTTGTDEKVPDLDPKKIPPGNDSAHWNNLLGEDENGNAYTFYVKETDKDGNDWVPEGFEKEESGLIVYNYKLTNVDVFGIKDWKGGLTPRPSVSLELWRKGGTAGTGEKVENATQVDATTNKVNFGKQRKTDINDVAYEYYVVEPEVPENYEVSYDGLTATNTYNNTSEVTLTAQSAIKTYDGTPLTETGVTATGLPTGFTVEATTIGSQTNASSSANVVGSYVIKDGNGVDQTDYFTNVTRVPGTLTVTKRQVTLTSATASKVYDGTALTNDTVTVGGDGWATGEGATYDGTGSQTVVGKSDKTFDYTL
ncbi:MAG: InlB B-repeat-containing protein, partial [Clostridia bacterium]|nr:InlB B-repeat-containing protein [Clostridia bacterium]